ncbi:hypothetical protein [Engelhardtia mirabilis]|uniref:Uncharacterized protein n=1 Tax=Engelhardtia mirabilis TaxID=2528011 RepID=A0A518BRR4_9BACT|nr:hypothetical protein Pla133_47670 [Planctomycetes bacterium Pla133]QDV03972.1 hypothetical protein Pla86_47650 [Planctomycetes bacterium Pla86]
MPDLSTDAGLRAACDELLAEPEVFAERLPWYPDFEQLVADWLAADREGRADLELHRRLWIDHPVPLSRHAFGFPAAALDDEGWREWFAEWSVQPHVAEDLEQHDVDRDAAVSDVVDDALRVGVELGGHDDDLVSVTERVLIEGRTEAGVKVLAQAAAVGVCAVDPDDVGRDEPIDRGRVDERLGENFAGRLFALDFDHDERAVGRDGEEVDELAVLVPDLAVGEHPLAGQDRRRLLHHPLKVQLGGQASAGEEGWACRRSSRWRGGSASTRGSKGLEGCCRMLACETEGCRAGPRQILESSSVVIVDG